MQKLYGLAFTLLASALYFNAIGQSNDHRLDAYTVQYGVDRIAHSNGYTLLMGSSIQQAGKYTGCGVALDATTAAYDSDMPVISGQIAAVVSDGQGGWYIGGYLNAVDNQPVGNLIHIKSDKTLDTNFTPKPDAYVGTLTLDGTTLYLGGNFSQVYGQNRSYIAAINVSTGTLLSWAPDANSFVHAIQVVGTTVYVGGEFTSIGGQSRTRLAALDATTGLASAWNPSVDYIVMSIAVQTSSNTIFIGGFFDTAGGQVRNGLAQLSLSTGLATGWAADTNGTGYIYKILLSGTNLFVAGSFSTVDGVARNSVALIGTTGTGNVASWDAQLNTNAYVYNIAINGTTLYLAGSFYQVNLVNRTSIAAVNTTSAALLNWSASPNSDVMGLATNGSSVFIGGYFSMVNPLTRNDFILLNESTNEIWPFTFGLNGGEIYTMQVQGNTLYIGGAFSAIDRSARKNLAAFDIPTGKLLSWAPTANGTTATFDNTVVRSMKIKDNTLYFGGVFLNVNGVARPNLAAVDLTSGKETTWNPVVGDGKTTSQYVNSIDIKDNTLYAGGVFSLVGGQSRTHLAAVDTETGTVLSWAPDVAGSGINKLVARGSTVYVTGDFPKSIGGAYRPYSIAALDATSAQATAWNPLFLHGRVIDIAANGYTLFASGNFDSVGVQPQNGVVSFDLSTTNQKSWNPDLTSGEGGYYIYALAASARRLYVGGEFYYAGNEPRDNYAEYDLCLPVGALTLNGSTLSAPAGTSYQWYLNGEAIQGATSQSLDINLLENGIYSVVVTSTGCEERSDDFAYLITGNESSPDRDIILYPNPTAAELVVTIPNTQPATIRIVDVMGRTLRTAIASGTSNHMNVSDLQAGAYLVKVQYGHIESTKKFIKK
ncbi:MAG TPA: T9SS type A sorting domain-containing protein [Ohtaekwangia sp.]|uniref:T9SS type A sorting domain-containing protein n=1 Tax=Ohtaekwangia sp. TaxID=2066019 RepID=UPI002F91D32C